MGKGENNGAAYLKISPKGKVPTLLIDGEPLTENVAIQLWIAKQFPDARLMPGDFSYGLVRNGHTSQVNATAAA